MFEFRGRNYIALAATTALAVLASLVGGVAVAGPAAAAEKPSYVYGIDDNNTIWEIDPINKVFYKVNETTLSGTSVSNSMAYDTGRDQFYFMYRGPDATYQNQLLFWDRQSTGASSVTAVANLGDLGAPGTAPYDPANAVYYDGSYWFLGYSTPTPSTVLRKVTFTYTSGKPASPTVTEYDLSKYSGTKYPGYSFGDIVVDPSTGMLYGASTSGDFFSIDLPKLSSTSNSVYTQIKTGNPSLQLSYNSSYTTIYAHNFTNGKWYTIATNGALTDLGFSTPVTGSTGFRDLGGASTTPTGATCEITPPGDSNNQTAWPGEAVAKPPSVTVLTPDQQPLPGVDIRFQVTSGGGDLGGDQTVTVVTDANGVAVAPTWTLGPTVTTNTVRATNIGTTCDLTFTAEARFSEIGLTKTPSPATYTKPGDKITYTIVAENKGNVDLSGVTVTDTKVPSLTCAPTTPVATLAPAGKITCTGQYTITQADVDAGKVDNTASTAATDPRGDDVTDSANATVTGPVKSPAITVKKTPSPSTYNKPGDKITYTIVAENTGNVTLTDVKVTDTKVPSLTCAPTTPAVLAPAAKVTCTGQYTTTQADVDTGKVDNTAAAEGTDPDNKKVTDDDTATITGPTKQPAIALTKAANPTTFSSVGDSIGYTITVENTGNVTLTNVKIQDDKIDLTCVPPRPVASLAPGAKATCTGTYEITQADIDAGKVDNSATTEGTDPDGGKVTDGDTATVTGPPANPALEVTKSADPTSFDQVGQKITYTIVAENTGNVTLTDVRINDPKVSSLTCNPTRPGVLAPGAKMTCKGDYTTTQADLDAGAVDNVATATGKDPKNNPVTDEGETKVPGVQTPGLGLTKTADPKTFTEVGQKITYTVVAENTGNVTLTDVQVTDNRLPSLICSPTTPSTLKPGSTITCTGEYEITEEDFDSGEVLNTASAIGTPPDGKQITEKVTETITGGGSADLSITKTHPAGTIYVNDNVTFTLTVKNNGPSRARNIKMVDTLPSQLGYVSATGNGWTCQFATPRVTCTRTDTLAAGQTAPVIKVVARALTSVTNATNVAVVSSTTTDPNPNNNTARDQVSITKRPQIGNPPIDKGTGTIVVKPSKTNANQPVQMKAFCRFAKKRNVAGDTTYCKVKYTKKGGIKVKTNRPYKVRVRMVFWAPATNEFFAYRETRKYSIKGKKKK